MLYYSLTFLGNYATAVNFLFSNSNMYTSRISMAKAILDFFIETKDAKHYSNEQQAKTNKIKRRSKQNTYHVVNKNIAPSKVTDERG